MIGTVAHCPRGVPDFQLQALASLLLYSRAFRPGPLRAAALILLTAAIWCVHNHRLTRADWSVPLDFSGDSLEILARIEAAKEGDLAPFWPALVRRLGAPFGANWSEYPGSDPVANHLLGAMARVIGVNEASNLALLLAHVTAALAFYFCARRLRHRWEWAFAGALLFAFSFFNLTRGLPHLWLTFTYTVPLAILTCWLVAGGDRTLARPGWRWVGYASAVALGLSNPYNLFMYLQLLAWSILARWLRPGWRAGVRFGLLCGALAVGAFAAIYAPVWLYPVDEGGAPLLVRNYSGTEIYALKPIELFLPPSSHHSGTLASVGHRYLRWSDWRGETFSPYLGLVGAAGLLWMLAAFFRDLLKTRSRRRAGHALPAMWIVAFSAIGGINSMLAFYFGLQIFRATNRYSVFLLALALLFVVARLSRSTRPWRPAWRLGLAAAVVALGLWDQIPRARPAGEHERLAQRVRTDRLFGAAVEARLGPGAKVFQFPLLDFPEGRPQHRIGEYEHFRPYLATRTLHFTYGARKGRARGSWQRDCGRLSPPALVRALESYGFAAIYIHRQGFEDRAEKLLAGLAAAGRSEILEGPLRNQIVVVLRPVDRPRLPLARSLTFGRGWNPRLPGDPAGEPRWTQGSASLSYYNPYPTPLPMTLRLTLSSVGRRNLIIQHNRRVISQAALDETKQDVILPVLELPSGPNRIDLESPEAAVRANEERWGLRAFGLHRMSCRVISDPPLDFIGWPVNSRSSDDPDRSGRPEVDSPAAVGRE